MSVNEEQCLLESLEFSEEDKWMKEMYQTKAYRVQISFNLQFFIIIINLSNFVSLMEIEFLSLSSSFYNHFRIVYTSKLWTRDGDSVQQVMESIENPKIDENENEDQNTLSIAKLTNSSDMV